MISRRRILAASAGVVATSILGNSNAEALVPKKSPKKKSDPNSEPTLPSTLAPEVLASPSKQVVFYSPHPDDELLSFGVIASEYVALGYEVAYVLLSSGSTTAAIKLLNGELDSPGNGTRFVYKGKHDPVTSGYSPLSLDDVGAARINEFKSSAGEMRIPPQNIYINDLLVDNALPETDLVATMIKMSVAYPQAIHWTMSTMDLHAHHRSAGEALRKAAEITGVKTAFTISRTTWDSVKKQQQISNPDIPETIFFKPQPDRMQRVRNAALPYNAWNPATNSFAIGYASVSSQFEDLEKFGNAQYVLTTPALEKVQGWVTSAL